MWEVRGEWSDISWEEGYGNSNNTLYIHVKEKAFQKAPISA